MKLGGLVLVGLVLAGSAQAQDKSAPAKFAGNPGAFFSAENYPPDARRAGQEGRVVVEITVGPEGRAASCAVTVSVVPSLDQKTCEIAMTRMSYTAALDAAGKPTTGKVTLPVRWSLENDDVAVDAGPVQVRKMVAEFDVWTDGTTTGCRILEPAEMVSQACPPDSIGQRMSGAATVKGKKVPSTLTITTIGILKAK